MCQTTSLPILHFFRVLPKTNKCLKTQEVLGNLMSKNPTIDFFVTDKLQGGKLQLGHCFHNKKLWYRCDILSDTDMMFSSVSLIISVASAAVKSDMFCFFMMICGRSLLSFLPVTFMEQSTLLCWLLFQADAGWETFTILDVVIFSDTYRIRDNIPRAKKKFHIAANRETDGKAGSLQK